MKRNAIAALLSTGALLLTAGCGNSDAATAKKNLSADLMKHQSTGVGQITQKQADCLAGGMVDNVGVDHLKQYKLLKPDLSVNSGASLQGVKMSKQDASGAADAIVSCIDASKTIKESLSKTMGSMTPQQGACIDKALSKDVLKTLFTDVFSGDQAGAQKAVTTPLSKCMTH